MTIKEMLEELEQYYEAAGYSDVYEEKLKYLSDEEIRDLYRETFQTDLATEEELFMMGFLG